LSVGTLRDVKIKGMACAVPENIVESAGFNERFGAENVEKFVKMTGVRQRHVASPQQTASDLCFAVADRLLTELEWERDSVGAVVFVSQSPDYRLPATACVLHKRLGLGENCVAFDVNLGCSGYVYGLFIAASLMASGDIERVLLLAGDTSGFVSPNDRSTAMLFGDGGSVTAMEKDPGAEIHYLFYTRGDGFKNLLIPSGACRNMDGSKIITEREDGNQRSDFDLYMNGAEIFSFTITDVPLAINQFLSHFKLTVDAIDMFVLHQANLFMLKHIAKKIGVPFEKVPLTIDRFGNTSVTSIPLTIVDQCAGMARKDELKLILSGFGVGLSWGVVSLELDASVCLPIIYTNEYYTDGGL